MDVVAIDHVNLRIPATGVADAVAFYGDSLGFTIEGLAAYRADEQSFFDVRLGPGHVIHCWPTEAFDPPTGEHFDHVALRVSDDLASLKSALAAADVEVERELDDPLGATGHGASVYVEDPFGYRIELKTTGG